MYSSRWVLALTLVGLASCNLDASDSQLSWKKVERTQSTQPIQGGTLDSTSSNVVAILIGAGQGGICSGSLIAPNLVLTAHHCVADTNTTQCTNNGFGTPFAANTFRITTSPNAAAAVFNGTAQWPTVNNTTWFGANLITVPTTPGNTICGADMALIQLTTQVPSICPLIPRVDSAVVDGENYLAVGFGITSPNGQTAGTRYVVGDQAAKRLEVACSGNCGQGSNATLEWVGSTPGQNDAWGVCEGDSGGPALDMSRRVLGTVSRGSAGSCNIAIYESVFGQAAWIKSVAAQAATNGGYQAASWVTGGSTSVNPCGSTGGGGGGVVGGGAGGGGGGGVVGGGAGGGGGGSVGGGGGSTSACPSGQMCIDASGAGDFACVSSSGGVPTGAPTCSQTVNCPSGYSCWQTGSTSFSCLADCGGSATGGGAGGGGGGGGGAGGGGGFTMGTCSVAGTLCVDATGQGNFACLDPQSSSGIPPTAATCSQTMACASGSDCWRTMTGNFCLEHCSVTGTGGGAGGGGAVGGGSGGGTVGGGAGGGTGGGRTGGGSGGGSVGGGSGGGSAGGGSGGGTAGGGTAGGGTAGTGGGFPFPGLPETPKKTGCSCNEVPVDALFAALGGLVLVRRRRRS